MTVETSPEAQLESPRQSSLSAVAARNLADPLRRGRHRDAAIGRELNVRGLHPGHADLGGQQAPTRRGVPIPFCNKIPISRESTGSILAVRIGEDDQGALGLRWSGLPEEPGAYEPGLSPHFVDSSERATFSYLVTRYSSATIVVPGAIRVPESVQSARRRD
ncbi:hypothetical protein [Streptomyces sp. NPDC048650]|uniref:hypothetical protein n=1 Tax=unclassified Streptomyces TaxID=2593676 RepID=UPI00371002CC